jgi:hypothetical protein
LRTIEPNLLKKWNDRICFEKQNFCTAFSYPTSVKRDSN